MTREEVLALMRENVYRPLNFNELVEVLRVEDIKKFSRLIRDMEQTGDIVRTRKDKFGIPEKMNLAVGRIQAHPKGFAFLLPEHPGMDDVFISPKDLHGAMHNDRVMVRLDRGIFAGEKKEGEVIRILERANKQLVGTFEKSKHFGFVVADDARINLDVYIPKDETKKAKTGDKVVVEITRWPENGHNPEGKVIEVLGAKDKPGVDVLSVIRKYQLPEEFPQDVLKEAKKIPEQITEADLAGRKDLRQLKMVTIDGEDAKDLDDAVSVEILDNGNYWLGVHIADVGYYVREGSSLDQEAFNRGTSVYLIDRVIPMLPPRLSNGICSLNAGVDRLAMTVFMEINDKGQVLRHEITPSVIQVNERMTYTNVKKILVDQDSQLIERYKDFVADFRNMEKLALILRGRRMARGAIDFNFYETKVILDDHSRPVDIIKKERTIAEQIIEEFMIIANEVIAEHFFWLEVPFLYRVHEEPGEEKINELKDFLYNLGYTLRVSEDGVHPRIFQKIVKEVEGKPEERLVNTVILRSMRHAVYDDKPLGHFGLAAQYYSHFTSPIRRYPDLVIHRVIREVLESGQLKPKRKNKLIKRMAEYAEQSSLREKIAEEAERETIDMKKIEYMLPFVGQSFAGVISGITSFGFFVELENSVEGLVHISTITDDYYQFFAKQLMLVGEHTKRIFRMGDKVWVKLVRVNVDERQIDFELVNDPKEVELPH